MYYSFHLILSLLTYIEIYFKHLIEDLLIWTLLTGVIPSSVSNPSADSKIRQNCFIVNNIYFTGDSNVNQKLPKLLLHNILFFNHTSDCEML